MLEVNQTTGSTTQYIEPIESVYKSWLTHGHIGTFDEFLQTIKGPQGTVGPKGDKGEPGVPGPQGLPGVDGTVTFENLTAAQLESLRGPQGIQGIQGEVTDPTPQVNAIKEDLYNNVLGIMPIDGGTFFESSVEWVNDGGTY